MIVAHLLPHCQRKSARLLLRKPAAGDWNTPRYEEHVIRRDVSKHSTPLSPLAQHARRFSPPFAAPERRSRSMLPPTLDDFAATPRHDDRDAAEIQAG